MTKTAHFLKKSTLYPALILESYFSSKKRKATIRITKYLLFSIPIIIILSILFGNYNISNQNTIIDQLIKILTGLAMFSLSIYILMQMFEAYFASIYYFEYIAQNKYNSKELYTFSVGRILRQAHNDNLLIGFLNSKNIGQKILYRLGINKDEIHNLLFIEKNKINIPSNFNYNNISLIKVSDLVKFIYENYADFKALLTNHGLDLKDLEATTNWVIYNIEIEEYNRQWWRKDELLKIPGVATDWSFGHTYLLNKFSRNLLNDKEVVADTIFFSRRMRELEQTQSILARSASGNVILAGSPGQEKMGVVWDLCRKIRSKQTGPALTMKKPLLFLTADFLNSIQDGKDFEKKLNIIFSEALKSGNVILVIDNFPRLILTAIQYKLNINEILEPYLASAEDQIIALADTEFLHTLIEPNQALMFHFEVVTVKPLLQDEIIKIISSEAINAEQKYEILYTYPAILEIAKSAEYYFPNGVSGDKARDILAEISPWAVQNNIEVINRNEVLTYVSKKTNIPISNISTKEKDKLINLEKLITKRVVAQKEAVFAVSNALRRSRAGIRNEKRPLGSFLFLGPTGVGKTETAKALAEVFFGSLTESDQSDEEKLLLRLDMSEYQNDEALARLIGSQKNNSQGILSTMLREHPYGVLLLDEFEKTNSNVLNLFLQIIDEGYFSDAFGKKVMARNIMFIATSNAGAEKIFEIIESGKNLKNYEKEIISSIIKQDIFKPELINRFDATVLFHPLTKDNLVEISKLMLEKIAKKLGEKGITFLIDKDLIDFIVQGGYNPTFGARPMNRLIQDTIEQHLADLIIRGQLIYGQNISFKVLANNPNKDSLKPIIL